MKKEINRRKKRVEASKWFDNLNCKPWTIRHFPVSLRHKLKNIANHESEKLDEVKTLEELVVELLNEGATKRSKKHGMS